MDLLALGVGATVPHVPYVVVPAALADIEVESGPAAAYDRLLGGGVAAVTATPQQAVLQQYGRLLTLPAVVGKYPALCRQAEMDGWAYQGFLRELLEAEVRSRHEKAIARRLKENAIEYIKNISKFKVVPDPSPYGPEHGTAKE